MFPSLAKRILLRVGGPGKEEHVQKRRKVELGDAACMGGEENAVWLLDRQQGQGLSRSLASM